jgi:hypothetical protein
MENTKGMYIYTHIGPFVCVRLERPFDPMRFCLVTVDSCCLFLQPPILATRYQIRSVAVGKDQGVFLSFSDLFLSLASKARCFFPSLLCTPRIVALRTASRCQPCLVSCLVLSRLSCVVLCCLVLSCVVLCCLVLSCAVLVSCLVSLPCLVLSRLSCVVLCCLVLSCVVLCCAVLSCLVLSCLVLFFDP